MNFKEFVLSVFSKEGEISSKRVFGSIGFVAAIILLSTITTTSLRFTDYGLYAWVVLYITSAILMSGDTIKDIVTGLFNRFKKNS